MNLTDNNSQTVETPKKNYSTRGKNPYRKPRVYSESLKDGTTRWVVDGRKHDGHRFRKYYSEKKEADTAALIQHTQLCNEGLRASNIASGLREEAVKCQELLKGTGYSLEQAVKAFLSSLPKTQPQTIDQASTAFLASRERKNNSSRSTKSYKGHIRAFAHAYPNTALHTITTLQIETYLNKRRFEPKTYNNHLGTLKTYFKFACKRGWCPTNPAEPIEKAIVPRKRPVVFSPLEALKLLIAAREIHPECLASLAIALFSGVRTAELLEVTIEMVKRSQKIVTIPADISKTRKERNVPISENLEAWLAISLLPTEGKIFPYIEKPWRKRIRAIWKHAGLPGWKRNGLRHSFATYHIAEHDNEHLTARACGNSAKMLRDHYDAVATREDANVYWSLLPTTTVQDIENLTQQLSAKVISLIEAKAA